jgi:hypothetical protein
LNKKSRVAVLLGVAALDLPPAVERRSLLIAEVGAEVGPYAAATAPLREQVGANPNPSG